MRRALTFILALQLLAAIVLAQTPGEKQPSVVLAPVGNLQLRAGSSANVELDFRIGPDFHVNSNKPHSELLIPTVLKLDAPEQVTIADVKYPPGQDLTFPFSPDEKLSVYSGDFAIITTLKAPASAAPGTYSVKGALRFQACDRSACYPPRNTPVEFRVTVLKK